MPARQDLDVWSNSDLAYSDRWTSSDGTPYILSAARFQFRTTAESADVLLEASEADYIDLDLTDGWANVRVPQAVVEAIDYRGVGRWDLVVTRASDGVVENIAGGYFRLREGVTRG